MHAVKPEPHNEIPQGQTAHNNFWDFVYLHPEATHMVMWIMSDRTIPRSFRMMQGFGVNTFMLVNEAGKRHFVKFHFIPQLGVHSLVWDEALKISGQDPDFHRKDLMNAIDNTMYPKWDFAIQVIPEEKQDAFEFDVLDATKIWPENLVPLQVIGELELNRNVDEFFPQTEQVAFCTSHIVPGIDFSDDPLLQGRNFSYFDTQISRLGVNWEELPINRPVCPVMNFQRDGKSRHRITQGNVNYWPNRFEACPPTSATGGNEGFQSFPAQVGGQKRRAVSAKFGDHFSHAQLFYNSLVEHEKLHILKAFSFELDHCDDPTVYTRFAGKRLADIDLVLAQAVADMVGAPMPDRATKTNSGDKAPRLSQTAFMPARATIASRMIAIIIGDGYDPVAFSGMLAAIKAASAQPIVIGTKRSRIYAQAGKLPAGVEAGIVPNHQLDGVRSTLFDATFIPGGPHIKALWQSGQVRHWIAEAFGHLKALGASGNATELIKESLSAVPDLQIASSAPVDWYGVVTIGGTQKPENFKEKVEIVSGAKDFVGMFFYQIAHHRNYQREMDGLASSVAF